MRFVRFSSGGTHGVGTTGPSDQITGLVATDSTFPGFLEDHIGNGSEGLAEYADILNSGRRFSKDAIKFLPPLTRPGKIICVGLNYSAHTKESGYEQPEYPTLFPRFTSSLIGHGAALVKPRISDTLDFEGELAVIIGKYGRHIPRKVALEHVAGYALFNDGSVREYQFKSPQWTVGKNFDGTGAFGPEFVTADELPAGASGLKIETRLNGETMQSSNTELMVFNVVDLISIISEAISLSPGDVIVTGTPSGIGHSREPKLYMKQGDICEVEIEGLGILRNPILNEADMADSIPAHG